MIKLGPSEHNLTPKAILKWIWQGEVVSTLGYHSGGPRFSSPPSSGYISSLHYFSSCLHDFMNSLEHKAAFIYRQSSVKTLFKLQVI